jgi:hypothetical protein
MVSNEFQNIPVGYLEGMEYETVHGISSNLPILSYMMGCVPLVTPQTFSRMVVLPALALPMMRMRKWGHPYRSLSIVISSTSATAKNQLISFSGGEDNILAHQMQLHQQSLPSPMFSLVRSDGLISREPKDSLSKLEDKRCRVQAQEMVALVRELKVQRDAMVRSSVRLER